MKKAILLVSFGTTVDEARKENIDSIVERVREYFNGYDVYSAFTSRIVSKRLRERGIFAELESEALLRLLAEGYEEIIVQPLHVVHGEEFDKLRVNIEPFRRESTRIVLGRPLLSYMGQDGYPDDYQIFINAFKAELSPADGVVFVGHGGIHPGNASYGILQLKLWQEKYRHVRVITMESFPKVTDIPVFGDSEHLPETVHIYLLLLVAGEHALKDIFGENELSIQSMLAQVGYTCVCHREGLGSRPAIQDIYIRHIEDAIKDKSGM